MPTRPPGDSSRPLLRDLSPEQQLEAMREDEEVANLGGATNGLTEAIDKLRKKLVARGLDDARKLAEAIATQLDDFLNKLPGRFGGRAVLRKVQCPVCQGAKRVQTRSPIIRWETCPRCLGQGQVYPPAQKKTIDLSHYLPKRLSKLQRAILVIALDRKGMGEEPAPVQTKQIRRDLRSRQVPTTNVGFSRALRRLEERGLLERETGGSREAALLREQLRLLNKLSGIKIPKLAKRVAEDVAKATNRLAWLNEREGKRQTVAVRLSAAGELAARALRGNG
jgi:hypothetical protein